MDQGVVLSQLEHQHREVLNRLNSILVRLVRLVELAEQREAERVQMQRARRL